MPRRKIIYVFLVATLLAGPFYFLRDEMDTEEIKKHRHWIAKTRNSETFAIVFGGDSRVFRGISPDHFEEEFDGYEAFNFAYWANGYGKGYMEGIEQKIDTGSDLRMIVLGVTPHSLTRKTARCEHYHWENSRSKEHVIQSLYLSKVQEIFAPYDVIELVEKLSGKSKPHNYRITYHPNGWVESYWIVPDTTHATRSYRDLFTDDPVSEEVIAGLLDFVERWTGMGIHVVGFRPPTSHAIREFEHERGGFREADFVERFTGAGGIWIPVSTDAYKTFDGSHLEHQSAMRISGDLARQIRARLSDL